MPNHVDQDLTIEGPSADLVAFRVFAVGEDQGETHALDANRFIPYPDEFRIPDENRRAAMKKAQAGEITMSAAMAVPDGYNAGGYEWCRKNWGTKWGIYDSKLTHDNATDEYEPTMEYTFQSAWSPPLPVIFAMSKRFPTLEFKLVYYERGMEFHGIYVAKGGECVRDESAKYFGNRGG